MTEQKWIYNGVEFAVGDKVQVVGFATEHDDVCGMGENTPWENVWIDDGMDEAINPLLVFEISEIDGGGAQFHAIERCPASEYGYPLSVLAKVAQ